MDMKSSISVYSSTNESSIEGSKLCDLEENIASGLIQPDNALISLFVLIMFQALDGIFTYHGVSKFGPEVEGNPLLKSLILCIGAFHAVTATKLLTVVAIVFLWNLRAKIKWVIHSLHFISLYYLFFALIPWAILIGQTYE